MSGEPTALQLRLADTILSLARSSGWERGHHLTEDSLQPLLGASRTPIRAAMAYLEESGVLERRPNKGFFLKDLSTPAVAELRQDKSPDEADIYRTIALDRLNHALPDTVSENELIRRYDLSRARLRHVLARIAAEGWVERRAGRGWVFLPLIDTLNAYRENYRFRQIMEPAAMRSAEFVPDLAKLRALQEQQVFVLEEGYKRLGLVELFRINSSFHEALAGMSGNRFFVQTLARLNQLRRLMEYGRPLLQNHVQRVCHEHLAIIEALIDGDVMLAANRLERHLKGAVTEKAPLMNDIKQS